MTRSRAMALVFLLTLVPIMNPNPARPAPREKPALAAFSDHFIAVWSELDSVVSHVHWSRIYGCTLDASSARVTQSTDSELRPHVATGSEWGLIVWESWDDTAARIRTAVVGGTGSPASASTPVSGAGHARRPACAISGDVGLLVWEEAGRLRYTPWDRDGGPRNPGGSLVDPGGGPQFWARVAGAPEGFLVVWSEALSSAPARIRAMRFDADAQPEPAGITVSDSSRNSDNPDAAWFDGDYLVTWNVLGPGLDEVEGCVLDSSGNASPVFTIAGGPHQNLTPRVAAGPDGFHVLWVVQDNAGRSLREARVDKQGALDPPGGSTVAGPASFAADPVIAVRDGLGLVAWRQPAPEDADTLESFCWVEPVGGIPDTAPSPIPMAWPNPFRGSVTVEIRISTGKNPEAVRIVDVQGRLVRMLPLNPGRNRVTWDGRNDAGTDAPSGRYLVMVPGAGAGIPVVRGK